MHQLAKIPKKNKNLAWRIIDAEAVVLSLENQPEEGEAVNIFNQTATRIWELCDGKKSVKEIIAQLKKEYAPESQNLESQVKRIIEDMRDEKLIQI